MSTQRGFTLIEIMLAMVIFAIVSTISFSALRLSLKTEAAQNERSQQLQELQIALAYIERDLGHAEVSSFVFDDHALRFESSQTSGTLKLKYGLENGLWVRQDTTLGEQESYQITLLKAVKDIAITPIKQNNKTTAINVQITHNTFGSIDKRIFIRD